VKPRRFPGSASSLTPQAGQRLSSSHWSSGPYQPQLRHRVVRTPNGVSFGTSYGFSAEVISVNVAKNIPLPSSLAHKNPRGKEDYDIKFIVCRSPSIALSECILSFAEQIKSGIKKTGYPSG